MSTHTEPSTPTTQQPDPTAVTLWHSMAARDAAGLGAWLTAVGFVEHHTYRDDADPSVVVHSEWLWPGGGGVMFGSHREGGALDNVGRSAAYLVVGSDAAVDDVAHRAVAAGGTMVREPVDQDYGGRGATVEDVEGNHWSIGSYQPS